MANEIEATENKEQVLALIKSERAAFEETLTGLGKKQMLQPQGSDGWTVKDILAHIIFWEHRLLLWTAESLRGGTPQRPAPGMTWDDLDKLNQLTYEANKDRPLDDVLQDFHSTYRKVEETVSALTQEDLFDGGRFAWRQGDPLWHMVAANTWWHYREHNETIRGWLNNG